MAIWKITRYIKETTEVYADTRKEALEDGMDNDFIPELTKTTCVKIKEE